MRVWSAALASAVPVILAAAMAVHGWLHKLERPPTMPAPQPPPTPSPAPSPPGSLAALFDGRPPLTPTAGPADGAAVAAAAASRQPRLWRGCTAAWTATKEWQQAPAKALGPLVPWMLAHTKRGRAPVEFVLTKPAADAAAAGLLKHMRPWEAMRPQLRNVSVAALLGAGERESLYHSGTLGDQITYNEIPAPQTAYYIPPACTPQSPPQPPMVPEAAQCPKPCIMQGMDYGGGIEPFR